MNVDVYIFLRFVVIFSEFFELLCSVLRVSPDTEPSRQDRSVSVPAESAAETATVNHGWSAFNTHTQRERDNNKQNKQNPTCRSKKDNFA